MADFPARLPKVELHVHLLGAAGVATVAELAARHPERGVPADPAALARFCEFTDFGHFAEVYTAVNRLVGTGADIEALVAGLTGDLLRDAVRYAEVTVTPVSHLKAGVDAAELAWALENGRRAAARRGLELAWVFDISGDDGEAGARRTVDWILRHQPAGTVALGLGGPERGVPRRSFRAAFDRARAAGLHSVPHAGELTGPAEIWAAVTELGAERIGHGLSAARDPRLLEWLAEHGIGLEVCLTSNLRTGAIGSLAAHPLPQLLAAGVPVTLGTDDPGLFGTTPNREYRLARDHFGLSTVNLVTLARQGVRLSFCPPATRRALLAELDRVSSAEPAGR